MPTGPTMPIGPTMSSEYNRTHDIVSITALMGVLTDKQVG